MRGHVKLACLTMLLVTGLAMLACQPKEVVDLDDPWGVIEVTRNESVVIGLATATSAPGLKDFSTDQVRGAELAIWQHGRVKGFALYLGVVDEQCSEDGGIAAAKAYASNSQIVAIIGHACSSSCLAAAPLYSEAGYTMISPSCGAMALTSQSDHENAFMRTIHNDAVEATLAARFAYYELGARQVAIVHDDSPESADLVTTFETIFTNTGGTIVAKEVMPPDEQDLRPLIDTLRESAPDLVYAPLLPAQAARLTTQRYEQATAASTRGRRDIPLLGGRYFWNTQVIDQTGEAAGGLYATGPVINAEEYEQLSNLYFRRYGEPPYSPLFAYAYDAAELILQAIEEVGVVDEEGTLYIGREALSEALYSTSTYPGLTGNLTCTNLGDCSTEEVGIMQAKDGEWVVVYIP
jgi:branched-chain amino acid transport system substrate-binding protein